MLTLSKLYLLAMENKPFLLLDGSPTFAISEHGHLPVHYGKFLKDGKFLKAMPC